MLKGYKLVPCQYCGVQVERYLGKQPATCIDCKTKNQKERDKEKIKILSSKHKIKIDRSDLKNWPWNPKDEPNRPTNRRRKS